VPVPLPLPALHATHAGIWIADASGEVREATRGEAIARAAETPHIILNAPLVGQRLGYAELSGLDLLELFAFIHPARFAVPTPAGLEPSRRSRAAGKRSRGGHRPSSRSRRAFWSGLAIPTGPSARAPGPPTRAFSGIGWSWAPLVATRLERPERGERMLFSRLPQWEESGERPPPLATIVDPPRPRPSCRS
jgi:ATP-dependent DNA helicase DinG